MLLQMIQDFTKALNSELGCGKNFSKIKKKSCTEQDIVKIVEKHGMHMYGEARQI